MTTPLPEPVVIDVHIPSGYKIRGFTKDQLLEYAKAYGAAEYRRAIEDAANVCHDMHYSSDEQAMGQAQCAHAISKLGATP